MMRIAAIAVIAAALCSAGVPPRHHRYTIRYFIATAFSVEGTGADGKWSHPGTVAADTDILPLNTRIRVSGAGGFSGIYTVEDTGSKVDGRHIDVFVPSRAEAKKFGRQRVRVTVLAWGDNEARAPNPVQKAAAKRENRAVRRAVANGATTTVP